MPTVGAGGAVEAFDETGAMVNSWTLEPGLGWRGPNEVPFAHGGRNIGETEIGVIVVRTSRTLDPQQLDGVGRDDGAGEQSNPWA